MDHDHTIIGWRAWYTEGRVYSSADTQWEDLPANGIILIMLYEATRPYRILCQGGSLYWRRDDGTIGQWGFGMNASEDPPKFDGVKVKGGDWVTDEEYSSLISIAMSMEDPPDTQ